MPEKDVISHRQLTELLDYDIETGFFTWRKTLSNRAKAGSIAGKTANSHGYAQIRINKINYSAHKLAVYYYSGIYPFEDVDHIDANRSNNKITNLRVVGATVNAQNRRNPSKNNKCGYLGVSFCKRTGRWESRIRANGVRIFIGRFDTPEDAHQAYLTAKRKHHEGNTL